MTDLTVRRLLIDLETPFERHWAGGDAFRSALFNALSMSFPVGEQHFIDSLRAGLQALPETQQSAMATEVKNFVAQEATHRRIHHLFNAHLERLGYRNVIAVNAANRIRKRASMGVKVQVASTAAVEHFTAMLSNWMFRHPEVLAGAEPRLQTLWLWHAAEEAEHRCTAFDMLRALDTSELVRTRVYRVVTFHFLVDVALQTARNLWHDGQLFRRNTWRSAWSTLFGPDGMINGNRRAWRDYLAVSFHPSQHEAKRAIAWLQDNPAQYSVVGAAS